MSENDFKKLAQDYINKKGEEYLIELRELETSSPAEFDASRMDAKMNAALEALKTETSKETSKATSKNPRRKFLAMWGSIAACVAIGIFVAAYALNNPFMDEMTPMSADYSQILGAQEHFDFDFDFVYGDSLDRRSMAGEMPVTAEFELTDEAESVEVESPEAESVEATIETAVPEETVELPLSDDPPVFRSEALDDADYLRERLREHDDIWHDGDDEAADDMAYTGGSLGGGAFWPLDDEAFFDGDFEAVELMPQAPQPMPAPDSFGESVALPAASSRGSGYAFDEPAGVPSENLGVTNANVRVHFVDRDWGFPPYPTYRFMDLGQVEHYREFLPNDGGIRILFTTETTVRDFKFLHVTPDVDNVSARRYVINETLVSAGDLTPEAPILLRWGNYACFAASHAFSFIDEAGATRSFALTFCNRDGFLLIYEF